ncbi:DUF1203 domain-containing protein [uncultured Roseibium sp.]|uniref:DUF1203 domain-containing protein n=1 Tax=uncultured Roseibium sp. TaxID=1936171 RepID=UPI00259258A8|nr:DUF1203 domain-containing protein [uncultured Roseibium sp.]
MFQIHPLPSTDFAFLSALSEEELAARHIKTYVADAKPGFPCRVSLEDAEVGETVFLLHFEHQPNDTPYRASHAIFVKADAVSSRPAVDTIPESIASRLLSVRAFDAEHAIVDAEVIEGRDVEGIIARMFDNPSIDYLHLHYARRGCFAAEVRRG